MNDKEKNWKVALKKAAHKHAMQHVVQPFAHKDGVADCEEAFIAGAEFSKKVWEQNLIGPSFKQIKEKYMKEYLSRYIYGIEDSHLEVITYDFNEGFKWNNIYGQDIFESAE